MLAIVQTYWKLIRGAKNWLAIALGLFCIAFVAALVVGLVEPGMIEHTIEQLPESNETGFSNFIHIAGNNLMVMLFSWCEGLVMGIMPAWKTVKTGYIGGGIFYEGSFTLWFFGILPHGIIELPAVIISNAFFLKFGLRWVFQKGGTARRRAFVEDFRDSLKIVLLCAVLFCIAASVEAFVTPKILAAAFEK